MAETTTEMSILVKLRNEASSQLQALNAELKQNSKEWRENFGEVSALCTKAGVAMAAMGATITGVMALSVNAARDDVIATNQLANSLENLGVEYSQVSGEINNMTTSLLNSTSVGIASQEAALTVLLRYTKDYDKALNLLPTALDLAAVMHTDVSSAANTLGRVMNGNTDLLEKYGINLKETGNKAKLLADLQDQIAGAAESAYDPISVLKETISGLASSIGTLLLPMVQQFVQWVAPIIQGVTQWIQEHQGLATALAIGAAAVGVFLTIAGGFLIILPQIMAFLNMIGVFSLPAFAAGATMAGGAMPVLAGGITALNTALLALAANPAFWAIIAVLGLGAIGLAGFGIGSAASGISSLMNSNGGSIPGLASGGTAVSGGLALVGERGKELISLPTGASVIPLRENTNNYQSNQSKSSSTNINNNIQVGQMVVRQESDIRKVANELWKMQNRKYRAVGVIA